MKKVSLSGSLRENVGKKDAKKLRLQGLVPCVLYGGKEQIHFAVPENEFKKIIFTPETYIVELDLNGQKYETILQDTQYHPVSDRLLHADFLQIFPNKKVTVSVPVRIYGNSPGVMKGGKLVKKYNKLRIQAYPANLPDRIDVCIDSLEIGMGIKVSDLKMEGVTFLDNPNSYVCLVKITRNVVEETTTETTQTTTTTTTTSPTTEKKAPEKK